MNQWRKLSNKMFYFVKVLDAHANRMWYDIETKCTQILYGKPKIGPARVPFMITKQMCADLQRLGFNESDIRHMTPLAASEILNKNITKEQEDISNYNKVFLYCVTYPAEPFYKNRKTKLFEQSATPPTEVKKGIVMSQT